MANEPDASPVVQPDVEQAPGWFVTDPDGNVVDSGPITEAKAASWVSELLAEAGKSEGGN